MTAEIAIMNKMGVALAADSAVTISSIPDEDEEKEKETKIYNTNKLFMLSKYQPVGIMIYNNAELLRVPWETIIKSYRKEIGDAQYDTLEEYGQEFITYLNRSMHLFPE